MTGSKIKTAHRYDTTLAKDSVGNSHFNFKSPPTFKFTVDSTKSNAYYLFKINSRFR